MKIVNTTNATVSVIVDGVSIDLKGLSSMEISEGCKYVLPQGVIVQDKKKAVKENETPKREMLTEIDPYENPKKETLVEENNEKPKKGFFSPFFGNK